MSERYTFGERVLDTNQPDETRFGHVTGHLYVTRERWDLAIPSLPENLRRRARQGGCRPSEIEPRSGFHSTCSACRGHVLADHDDWYLPAALSAFGSALRAGHHGRVQTRQGPREIFVGANAVQVITHLPGMDGEQGFVTAYRDPPGGREPTNAQFHAKAVRKLRDKASLGSGDPS